MYDPKELAYFVDRFVRLINSKLHHRALEMDSDRVGQFGGFILMALAEHQPMPIHELVSHMGRDKSQVTRAVQTLENKGYIVRSTSIEDARISILKLTEKGHAFVKDITEILADVIGGLTEPLEETERETLLALLRKI